MAVQYAPQKLRVPPGFQNILEGFAREVLREQPEDIIQFGAQYFKTQVSIRDETGKDDAKKGENLEKLQKGEEVDIDLNDPEVQAAATKIQASFRGHKVREENKAKIKASKESISSTAVDAEKPTEKPSTEEVDIDLNDPEVGAAALKIQASFRGHKARNEVQKMKSSESVATPAESAQEEKQAAEPPVQDQPAEEPEAEVKESSAAVDQETSQQPQEEEIDIDLNDPEVSKAATKIQATFRGHKTRKGMKDASPSQSKESVKASESTQEAAAAAPEAESLETVPEPTQEDTAPAETTEDAAPSEAQEVPSESQDAAEVDSAKPDEEPTQEAQSAGEKTEETPEVETIDNAPEGEAEKVEDSPTGETEKKDNASEGDGEKTEDPQEGESEKAETTTEDGGDQVDAPEGEGEKVDAPVADKTEDAPEGEKTDDAPAGDAEKPEETPQGEGENAAEAKEGES